MIMKNEGPILPRLFESVQGFVSEYCIVDTGSTDDTIDVLKSMDMPGLLVCHNFAPLEGTKKAENYVWKRLCLACLLQRRFAFSSCLDTKMSKYVKHHRVLHAYVDGRPEVAQAKGGADDLGPGPAADNGEDGAARAACVKSSSAWIAGGGVRGWEWDRCGSVEWRRLCGGGKVFWGKQRLMDIKRRARATRRMTTWCGW